MSNKGFLYNGQSISGQTSRECLSPLPIDNGRPCTLINKFIGIEDSGVVSLNNSSTSVKWTQTSLIISAFLWLFLISMTIWSLIEVGPLGALIAPGFLLVVGGGSLALRFYDALQDAKYNLPLIFNAKKGKVLISWRDKLKKPQIFASGSVWLIFCLGFGGTALSGGFIFTTFNPDEPIGWIFFVVSFCFFSVLVRPWIKYFQEKKKHPNDVYFEEVPWEKVRIEYQEGITLSMVGPGQLRALWFVMYLPESKRIYRNSIGVLSL